MIDLEELKKKAEAATPGPWERHNAADVFTPLGAESRNSIACDNNDGWHIADCSQGPTSVNGELIEMDFGERRANADFIAAANPAVVLELIERLERAESSLKEPAAWISEHKGIGKEIIDRSKIQSIPAGQYEYTPLYAGEKEKSKC